MFKGDVAVIGGGSAGCAAALAAAHRGASTFLVDRWGFVGGIGTAVLDTFYAFFTAGENPRKVVSGIPDLPVERLKQMNKVIERPNTFGSGMGYTYDPETLKLVWTQLLREAGVHVLLHTPVVACSSVDGRVVAVQLYTKAGLRSLAARNFVDATGDADVVMGAGGHVLTDTQMQQPVTLTFRIGGVDVDLFYKEGRPTFRDRVEDGRREGYRLYGRGGSVHRMVTPGLVLASVSRVSLSDINDPEALALAEFDGLGQVFEWMRFLRDRMPGFRNAEIVSIAPTSGFRETRRIQGQYVLTRQDVLNARRFADEIAWCGAPIEDLSGEETLWERIPDNGFYGVPWASLLPAELKAVAVAGRCLSADHFAHASARSMGTCMAMGQAAGTAAALASQQGIDIGDIDVNILREALIKDGAMLESCNG